MAIAVAIAVLSDPLQDPAPEDSTNVLALFSKIDEADLAARRDAPAIPEPPDPSPGPDAMREILIRLVQAQEFSAAHGMAEAGSRRREPQRLSELCLPFWIAGSPRKVPGC